MNAAVAVALITAIASLVVALLTSFLTRRRELGLKKVEREAEAAQILERYRGPLLAAAFDLQDRLDNILNPKRDFLAGYGGAGNPRRDDAIKTTLYRVAQYLCWVEIIRRDLLFLTFHEPKDTKAVSELLGSVGRTFADDRYGRDFMLWREEQRAIGERMIDRNSESANCIGYATFVETYPRKYARWFDRFEARLNRRTAMASKRLDKLRRTLRSLVAMLDPEQLRYERDWEQPPEVSA